MNRLYKYIHACVYKNIPLPLFTWQGENRVIWTLVRNRSKKHNTITIFNNERVVLLGNSQSNMVNGCLFQSEMDKIC